ncbi:MAG: hypothetical protein EOP01_04765, partial [Propionibacteriaceae bacterium]
MSGGTPWCYDEDLASGRGAALLRGVDPGLTAVACRTDDQDQFIVREQDGNLRLVAFDAAGA